MVQILTSASSVHKTSELVRMVADLFSRSLWWDKRPAIKGLRPACRAQRRGIPSGPRKTPPRQQTRDGGAASGCPRYTNAETRYQAIFNGMRCGVNTEKRRVFTDHCLSVEVRPGINISVLRKVGPAPGRFEPSEGILKWT